MYFAVSFVLILTIAIPAAVAAAPRLQTEATVYIYFFWGDGCPHCAEAKPFLEQLAKRYPRVQIESYEVWYNPENRLLFQLMADNYDLNANFVPTIMIGDQSWVGWNEGIGEEIESAVQLCLLTGCPDPGVGVIPGREPVPENGSGSPDGGNPESDGSGSSKTIRIPLIGEVDLSARSLWVSTALIGFVDGFNPCSLWVLSILIALTLRTGSRRKMFIIGFTFITVTALVYVLFIAGLFTMLTFMQFLNWIQAFVSLMALFFAFINIKDYFWYKEGISLTIDDAQKPGIYKRMRKVMQAGDSLSALVPATVGLGLGVSLVEFSCTAGFPVLWTNLVAAQNVTPVTFFLLLLLYMVIYQIDELGIFAAAVITLRASRLEEKHGRILKLVGGTLMLTLAGVMLLNPSLMNDLWTSVLIFGVAFAIALLVLLVHRVILPRFGIRIGTELELGKE
jgi:thiol-disulfide isomerase/thioredoxin